MNTAIISGERHLDHAEMAARAAKVATGFDGCGIVEGDAVALVLRNDFAFFEAAQGAAIVGAYAVPVNWHSTSSEVNYILKDCGAKVVVIHADLLPDLREAIPGDAVIFVVPTPPEIRKAYRIPAGRCAVPAGCRNWNDWLEEQSPWRQLPCPVRTNIIYTSGTTGAPKGVVRNPPTPEQVARFAEILGIIFGMGEGREMRTVITGPIYHAAPNAYALFSASRGGLVVLQPRFDAENLLELIERHRITHLHMVPIMFVRLLKLPDSVKAKYDLSSLEFVVHAAAPCSPEVKRRMINWWGPVINEYYGSTETGPPVFHTSEEALRKPGTVGRQLDRTVVKILDAEGWELPLGEVGDIYLRVLGHSDFTYKNNESKRREIERDGLITVGDIGYLDEDGYLFICDRASDMVISGGVNIHPAEIEAALIEMPGVRDCAVFGIPDEEFGEVLCAHIEPDQVGKLTSEQVTSWLQGRVAKYKVPKHVVFVNSLPREDSGKIMKRKLRDAYWKEAGRNI
jgi:long-chain acyl-CoA synthetase